MHFAARRRQVTREHRRVSVFKPKYGRQLLKRDTKQVAQEDLGSLNDYQGSDSQKLFCEHQTVSF
jgi:hypothetical protein